MTWKEINKRYEISDLGQVRNKETGRILKSYIRINGYEAVGLHINKKNTKFSVHRLVAKAFLPNPDNFSDVDHINRNRIDNRLENLRWASRKQNLDNGITKEKFKKKKIKEIEKIIKFAKDGFLPEQIYDILRKFC